MRRYSRAEIMSHLLDGLCTLALAGTLGYIVHAAYGHWLLTLSTSLGTAYLLVAFFWAVMPLLNHTLSGVAAIIRMANREGGPTTQDEQDADSAQQLLSGVGRGRNPRFKMGFSAPHHEPSVVPDPAPPSSPTVA